MTESTNLLDPHKFSARFYIYEKPIFCLNLAKDFSVFSKKGLDLWEKRITEIQTEYTRINNNYKELKRNNTTNDRQIIREKYFESLLSLIDEVNNVCNAMQLQILTSLSNLSDFNLGFFFKDEDIEPLKIKSFRVLNEKKDCVYTDIENLIGEIAGMRRPISR